MAAVRNGQGGGMDKQKQLDCVSHKMVMRALKNSPVAWVGSEEGKEAEWL